MVFTQIFVFNYIDLFSSQDPIICPLTNRKIEYKINMKPFVDCGIIKKKIISNPDGVCDVWNRFRRLKSRFRKQQNPLEYLTSHTHYVWIQKILQYFHGGSTISILFSNWTYDFNAFDKCDIYMQQNHAKCINRKVLFKIPISRVTALWLGQCKSLISCDKNKN